MVFPLFSGLIASMLHVIMGPDHLAAVLPFALESKRKAWKVGLFWAMGHVLGMLLIGLLFMVFKEVIPVEKISGHSEQLVGVVLIFIGVWAFYKIFAKPKGHKHMHIHAETDPIIHKHAHQHVDHGGHEHSHGPKSSQNLWSSFSIGVLHGFAGISHFILFLPVLGFDSTLGASKYIVGFVLGIIVSMTLFSLIIGQVARITQSEHNPMLFKGIQLAGGIFAIVIGIYWLLSTGTEMH